MNRLKGKIVTCLLAVSMAVSTMGIVTYASEATVTKGEFDFSDMVIRRVWFNTEDPVFMVDDYDRIWLDRNVNVLTSGNYKEVTGTGTLMAPMEEMFRQIGGEYNENGNTISIKLNGDTLVMTIGSQDVEWNGTKVANALLPAQVPQKVNAKENGLNPFLKEDYFVTYLPVAYILNSYQADIYTDSLSFSFYAAIPIFKTEQVPSLETVASGYGIRYDNILDETAELSKVTADNIISIQNKDGGFSPLPANTNMEQIDLKSHRGSLVSASSLENGSTIGELKYLAKFITDTKPTDTKYANAFAKGIQYLVTHQHSTGGWQTIPSEGVGFNGNVVLTDGITTDVLGLLSDIALLNNQNYVFARKILNVNVIKTAIDKGNEFILSSQLAYGTVKSGWSAQYDSSGNVTMGKTYERESVSAFATKEVVDYLMTVRYPSSDIIRAVNGAAKWLENVKIKDKEQVVIKDVSMQNGFDIYLLSGDEPGIIDNSSLLDGLGTWAANYVYEDGQYRPLYADIDPSRPDQPEVNNWNAKKADSLIWYATRTSVTYFDNNLATELLDEGLTTWRGYLTNGWPKLPVDEIPEPPTPPTPPTPPNNNSGGGSDSGSGKVTSGADASGNWQQTADGRWWFAYKAGSYPSNKWEKVNGKWYFFDEQGYIMTGWVQNNGKWYFCNTTGEMLTNWVSNNGKWYFLSSNGETATNWVQNNGKWYFLNDSGAMETGWKNIGGKWYFMNTSGDCVQNGTTPDGYSVDASGAWIQ